MQTPFFQKLPVAVATLAFLSCFAAYAQTAPVAPPAQISGIVPPPLPLNSSGKVTTNLIVPAPPVAAASAPKEPSGVKDLAGSSAGAALVAGANGVQSSSQSSNTTGSLVLPAMPLEINKASKDLGSIASDGSYKKTSDTPICAPAPVVAKKPDLTKTPSQKINEKEAKSKDPQEKSLKSDPVLSPFSGLSQTQVSDTQLNQFIFPEPVEGLYFPEGSPLPECPKDATPHDPCKPVFLNGRQLLLLPLRIGAKGPVQMLAHLHSGRMITFNLAPVSGPGTVIRVEGADYAASDARTKKSHITEAPNSASSLQADIALLDLFVNGQPAPGFESVAANPTVRMDNFDVIPMSAWIDGNKLKVHLLKIQPKDNTPVKLTAALFQTDGVRAVALDKESATKLSPSFVYVLEEMQ